MLDFNLQYNIKFVLFYMLFVSCLFWPCHAAYGVLVPQPRIGPRSSLVRMWSPSHWTTREFSNLCCFKPLNLQQFVMAAIESERQSWICHYIPYSSWRSLYATMPSTLSGDNIDFFRNKYIPLLVLMIFINYLLVFIFKSAINGNVSSYTVFCLNSDTTWIPLLGFFVVIPTGSWINIYWGSALARHFH